MALRPVCGRAVWARCPASGIRTRSVPWHPASTSPPVGSPRMAASAASRSGRYVPQPRQSVELLGHLLAGVEAPGDVHRRLAEAARPGGGRRPAHPSCRPRRGRRGWCLRSGARRFRRPEGRCRDGRRAAPDAPDPSWVRATTLSPTRSTSSHGQSSRAASTASAMACSWWLTDGIPTRAVASPSSPLGHGPLGYGHHSRRHHPVTSTPRGVRRMSLSWALSCRWPSVRRFSTSTHGR